MSRMGSRHSEERDRDEESLYSFFRYRDFLGKYRDSSASLLFVRGQDRRENDGLSYLY
jgi:hypothetical protein